MERLDVVAERFAMDGVVYLLDSILIPTRVDCRWMGSH